MNLLGRVFSFLLGISALAVLVYLVFVLGKTALAVFTSLDKTVAGALIAASATIVVSVATVVLGNLQAARQKIDEAIRDRKIPVYEELLSFIFRIMEQDKSGKPVSETEMFECVGKFNRVFMVWGADNVVAAYSRWRRQLLNGSSSDPAGTLFTYEDLLFAIRRDLGHSNKGLVTGDLLSLFINDVDAYLPRKKSRLKTH